MKLKDFKEAWDYLDWDERIYSIFQLVFFVLFTFWIFANHWIAGCFVYGIPALIFYILHQRDIYYGYGQCVANHYNGGANIYMNKIGNLQIDFPNGSKEYYLGGGLAEGVYKLLTKNGCDWVRDERES